MNTVLDPFESALLDRLRAHAGQEPRVHTRSSRRRVLLGACVTAAAAAAGVVVLVPGLGAAPAYSVQKGNSGTITVEVRRAEDAEGLEDQLANYGVHADVTYVPHGQECAPGRYTPVRRSLSGMTISIGSGLQVTLPPGTIRHGETFVVAVSQQTIPPSEQWHDGIRDDGGSWSWTDVNITSGPVQPCRIIPSTAGDATSSGQ